MSGLWKPAIQKKPEKCVNLESKEKPEKCGACGWEPKEGQTWGKIRRKGLGFYALRHTFRTIADSTKDFPAVRLIMGHSDAGIDAAYREEIDDGRLRAVADHVRPWLWPNNSRNKLR